MKLQGKLILLSIILSASSFCALGQTARPRTVQKTPSPAPDRRTNADETFELNIDERRFSQESFEASTSVETDADSRGLNLQIGVALAAGRIDVLMRNVHGNVRFRGTLDRVLEMISKRRAPLPAPK